MTTRPDERVAESALLPRLECFRPRGSTSEVLFRTAKPARSTVKIHVSHVVLDTKRRESSVAYYLEQGDSVYSYVKNDHLDFSISYEFGGSQHVYLPDFLVKMNDGKMVILEVKAYKDEQTRAKGEAAKRWCEAVSRWGQMGEWEFVVCREPNLLREIFAQIKLRQPMLDVRESQ